MNTRTGGNASNVLQVDSVDLSIRYRAAPQNMSLNVSAAVLKISLVNADNRPVSILYHTQLRPDHIHPSMCLSCQRPAVLSARGRWRTGSGCDPHISAGQLQPAQWLLSTDSDSRQRAARVMRCWAGSQPTWLPAIAIPDHQQSSSCCHTARRSSRWLWGANWVGQPVMIDIIQRTLCGVEW